MIHTFPNGTVYNDDLKFLNQQDEAFQKYANHIMSLDSCLVESESISHITGHNKNGDVIVYDKKVSCDNFIKLIQITLWSKDYTREISNGLNIEILNN